MIWPLVALLTLGGSADPRIEIIEARLQGELQRAIELAETAMKSDAEGGRSLGLDYLRGDLLERLEKNRDADRAFAETMSGHEALSAYARYRLALSQNRRGHPEVAAGLLATLLARNPPEPLEDRAARLFADTLSHGGDCRLLRDFSSWQLAGAARRLLEVVAIECSLSTESGSQSQERLLRLLEETVVDEAARLAAERLHRHFAAALTRRQDLLLVGRAFHHQRRFSLSRMYLARGLAAAPAGEHGTAQALEDRYALARSHFWLADYQQAATEFARVAAAATRAEDSARALYQQARSYELAGSWPAAINSFRQAYLEEVEGRWAGAALLSILRLEWLLGSEEEALTLLEVLGSRRSWSALHGRAALFLASSDIVQERADRAGPWLVEARLAHRSLRPQVHYWKGRLEEQLGNFEKAAQSYDSAIADDAFQPFAQLARRRLASDEIGAAARTLGLRLASSSDTRSLARARLLLGNSPEGEQALARANSRLALSRSAVPFLTLDFIEPSVWPMWDARLDEPEELLLALGIWHEGAPAARRYFPPDDISLAYTGSRLLASDGAHRSALLLAEIVYEAARARMPEALIPVPLRRSVFPLHYGTLIASSAGRHRVDPYLLTALIREESRFDTQAVSVASARGLTQFVLTTARRLASRAGFGEISSEDLYRPEVSIALGAAYLEELLELFDGREHQAIAAYNAGEDQAELWQEYCYTLDPAEFLTKIAFPETRGYISKVLASRAQYADLYPPETFATR